MTNTKQYETIVIGVSAGGFEALKIVLSQLPNGFVIPIIIVQHRARGTDDFLCKYLAGFCSLQVKEAEEKESVSAGYVYVAPPDYHLLVEMDRTLSLSVDPPVNYSRPSIDVLFETAAEVYKERLIGVVMTGANNDGSMGLEKIKRSGGLTVVQDPKTAAVSQMPLGAIAAASPDHVLPLAGIGRFLAGLMNPEFENWNK